MFYDSGVRSEIMTVSQIVNTEGRKINFWNRKNIFVIGHLGNWKDRKNIDKLIICVDELIKKKIMTLNWRLLLCWYNNDFKPKIFKII